MGDAHRYAAFFKDLTGHPPYPFQERLAAEAWPDLLDIPTGLGKTAAVVVAWLDKLRRGDATAGRRLVYCLPMRTLVEQTRDAATKWCEKASQHLKAGGLETPRVHVLMGGDLDEDWARHPERPAILVGTQDMLLSRALNRGYGTGRFRWPMQFGLLHSDCTWVFDETQLMGVGVETSAQLEALRDDIGSVHGVRTLWMSATLGDRQLETVDHPRPDDGWQKISLEDADHQQPSVSQRTEARKPIEELELLVDADAAKSGAYAAELAAALLERTKERGGLTLAVLNRVDRAQQVFQALQTLLDGDTETLPTALIHSRFRPADRREHEKLLFTTDGGRRIVVATQAVEAGVDVSARTLVTELAPWPSLVQRFGRCNRQGEDGQARIGWIDVRPKDAKDDVALPYNAADLDQARELLGRLGEDAGPLSLREIEYLPPDIVRPVLRRKDLLDLFDTTPDLGGNDLDISRYVRDTEDTDVQLYWRDVDVEALGTETDKPTRDELCRVAVGAANRFLQDLRKKRRRLLAGPARGRQRGRLLRAWAWDPLAGAWRPADRAYPGQQVKVRPEAGGYDPKLGWTGEVAPKEPPPALEPEAKRRNAGHDSQASDPRTAIGRWIPLTEHLDHVAAEARALASAVGLDDDRTEVLVTAARWHDVGKAHPAFQERLIQPTETHTEHRPPGEGLWAKSSHRLPSSAGRAYFRHELASALAWLAQAGEAPQRDLVAYLIAAHHGKVRASIRALPDEQPAPDGRAFARGVWDGDELPAVELPGAELSGSELAGGERVGPFRLDLGRIAGLGEDSWLERVLALRDALGPFRLAYLEALLIAADWRASAAEEEGSEG